MDLQTATQMGTTSGLDISLLIICAILVAMLLLVGYIDTVPASIAFGWRWAVLTLCLPLAGSLIFSLKHWTEFAKSARQLMIGLLLVAVASGALYAFGPYFAVRAVHQAQMEQQKQDRGE